MITRQTLDQQRAQSALARHQKYPQPDAPHAAPPRFWSDYSTTANGLPPAIRSNGLILALATEVARADGKLEPGQIAVLADLCAYLGAWSVNHALNGVPDVRNRVVNLPVEREATETELKTWRDTVVEAGQQMLSALIEAEPRFYQVIGEEALAYLAWLKTLAKPKEKAEERAKKKRDDEAKAAAAAATTGATVPEAPQP